MPEQPASYFPHSATSVHQKTAEQQFAASRLGLQYYSLRFIDAGRASKT
jgi:hypothetical protein